MPKNVVIIGSTGSVGRQALSIIRENPKDFCVAGLAAHSNKEHLTEQHADFKPEYGVTLNREEAEKMVAQKDVDIVVIACSGTDYIPVLMNAIRAGKKIVMANKEMIVEEGEMIMSEVRKGQLIPIDSEHCAIFQILQNRDKNDIEKVIITCSGGPFFGKKKEELKKVTVEEALNHPKWSMGSKITIDSATQMNKALEIIEAKYLFDLEPEQIEVLVHPECIVHAIVQFKDGNSIAHFGYPDMRIPISYGLYYPEVGHNDLPRADFAVQKLSFYKPDLNSFPSIGFAYDALTRKSGKSLNRANDQAVEKFINGEISFLEIFYQIQKEI